MFIKYISFLVLNLPIFVYKRLPLNLVHFYKNYLQELDNKLGVRLNANLFFTPLYGDSHWSFRLVGILYRLFKIVFGLIVFALFSVLLVFFSFSLIIGPLVLLAGSIELFVLCLLLYYFFYIGYYLYNPFEVISYDKTSYNFFDVYKMSNRQTRKVLLELINNKNIEKHFAKMAAFFEVNVTELAGVYEGINENEQRVSSSIISVGKFADYRHISTDLLLSGCINFSSKFIDFINAKNLSPQTLMTYLVNVKHDGTNQRAKIWDEDYVSKFEFPYNAARVDGQTPILNKFALSFNTDKNQIAFSYLKDFKNYKLQIQNILVGGNKKVLILGDPGTGKTSLVKDFYNDIKMGRVSPSLKFNRIVSVDLSSIVSMGSDGTKVLAGALLEFSRLKNTILFLDNLHIMYSVDGTDYMSILSTYLDNPKLKIVATSDKKTYLNKVKNENFSSAFNVVKINEISGGALYNFLTIKNWDLQKKLTIPAIEFLTNSSSQVMFDTYNPQKSLKIIDSASSNASVLITKKDIANVIKNLTGVTLGEVGNDERQTLMSLGEKIKKEVVGQNLAVDEVVDSLIRARGSRGSDGSKPIASFLFAGPTGVGKTELAKALSRNYFKGEKNIIRIDMSEYQTAESINRLIGSENGEKPGVLTEAVKENPFNLLLLDEIEKAADNIHMLFLQVLDDGRLTDARGVTVSFKNIIIIATTNAATSEVIEGFSKGLSYSEVRSQFLANLKGEFPPEFLNRFTEIILFNPLGKNVIGEVLEIKFNKLKHSFYNNHKISINLDPALKEHLLSEGYSKEWGARNLERVLEKSVDTALSKALVRGVIKPGDTVLINKQFIVDNS